MVIANSNFCKNLLRLYGGPLSLSASCVGPGVPPGFAWDTAPCKDQYFGELQRRVIADHVCVLRTICHSKSQNKFNGHMHKL